MTKTKTTIDISSLQDFVLNERNIETILKHISNQPKITKKSVIKTQSKIKPVSIDNKSLKLSLKLTVLV